MFVFTYLLLRCHLLLNLQEKALVLWMLSSMRKMMMMNTTQKKMKRLVFMSLFVYFICFVSFVHPFLLFSISLRFMVPILGCRLVQFKKNKTSPRQGAFIHITTGQAGESLHGDSHCTATDPYSICDCKTIWSELTRIILKMIKQGMHAIVKYLAGSKAVRFSQKSGHQGCKSYITNFMEGISQTGGMLFIDIEYIKKISLPNELNYIVKII